MAMRKELSELHQLGGMRAFLADVEACVAAVPPGWVGSKQFIRTISDRYAFIRLEDLKQPIRFLKQAEGDPPFQFGTLGFKSTVVDDKNPARHYTAFVFVGFWLPSLLATLVLWIWEILGFIRYGGQWSANDMRCGQVGIRHGRLVRRDGPAILPELIRRDLAEDASAWS
jgi:hypothetical protein